MLTKRTSKNQITLPKAVVKQVGDATYFSAAVEEGRVILTPVNVGAADAVRRKIKRLGITEGDIDRAVSWSRKRR